MIGPDEVRERLSMSDAIAALESFFAEPGEMHAPERAHLSPRPGTELLVMPAWDAVSAGVKLITINPAGKPLVDGVYCLFDHDLKPKAVIDAAALTALRTAAVSGVATKLLAREDAATLVVFGAGVQARAHVEAMRAVRDIDQVVIVSPAGAGELAEDVGGRVGSDVDVSGADIICTCTTSGTPVFDGKLLTEGVHINAVGAHQPEHRELDDAAMAVAIVIVEDRQAASRAGDLLMARPPLRVVADLFELATGHIARSASSDITVFKSVGVAYEDLVIARSLAG